MAELTDRRQRIANAQSSLSLSSLTESTERQNRWCKNYNPRFRPSSTGNSDDQWFGLSRIKRTQMLLWFVIVITFFRLGTLLPNVEQADAVDSVQKNITETKHDSSSSSSSSNGGKSVPTTSDLDKPTLADDRISDPAPPQTGMIVVKDKDEPPIIDDSNDDDTKSEKQNKESRKKKSKNDKAAKPKLTSPPSPTLAESDAGAGAENKESNPIPAEGYVEDKKGKNSQSSAQDPNNKDDDANSAVPKTTETTKDALLEKLEANDEDEDDGVASPSEATIPQTTKQGVADTDSSSSNLHNPRSDSDLSETASKFVETHCDLNNVQDGQWYPLGEENEWKQRAPYVIVAGVWNAGVNPLANALLKHPRINTAKQNGFFLPKQFKKYIDVVQPSSSTASDDVAAAAATATTKSSKFNVKVFAARERMYAQVYSKSSFQQQKAADTGDQESLSSAYNNSSSSNNNRVAMDVSPGLIFYAHQTAHSILCTAPWVKVVVVLRNPIDRLYQQWVYSTTHLGLKLSLEDWMAPEMKLLQTVGLISGTGTGGSGVVGKTAEANGVEAKATLSEKDAWNQYQSVHKMAGAIGRSLYVFQLEQWIKAYIAAGKNPYEEIIILTTEEIEDDPVHQYGQLIQFLGLPPLDPKTDANDSVPTALQKSLLQRNNSPLPPMEEETRKMLRRFFKPYNKRLAELLQSNGFEGEWDKRWKN